MKTVSLARRPLLLLLRRRPIVFSFHAILLPRTLTHSLASCSAASVAGKSAPLSIIVAIFSPLLGLSLSLSFGGRRRRRRSVARWAHVRMIVHRSSASVRLLLSHCVCVLCVSKCLITG